MAPSVVTSSSLPIRLRNEVGAMLYAVLLKLEKLEQSLHFMAIVVRSQGGKWQKAAKVEFAAEAQLQKLLYDSPELIPTSYEEDQPAVFIREAGLPGSGYTDLLGVDERGNILVVETKHARNDEVRRKVIGQVLDSPQSPLLSGKRAEPLAHGYTF